MSFSLESYHSPIVGGFSVSAMQASRFAKECADDFNPIHNADSARFCVPGDLLFALSVKNWGLCQRIDCLFEAKVGADEPVYFHAEEADCQLIKDDKPCVSFKLSGKQVLVSDQAVADLTAQYVAYSGQNYPHTIQPLLDEQGVMLNPNRPTVIYRGTEIEFNVTELSEPELVPCPATLTVNGKRAECLIPFEIHDGGKAVGKGEKLLLLSGLMPNQEDVVKALVDDYLLLKAQFTGY